MGRRMRRSLLVLVALVGALAAAAPRAEASHTIELVKDIMTSPLGSSPVGLKEVGGKLFFTKNTGSGGFFNRDLVVTNGTQAGTSALPPHNGNPAELSRVGATLFYTAHTDATGFEIWRSDGTQAGTALVTDLAPGSSGSSAQALTGAIGKLFFSAEITTATGRELYASDGTPGGTVLVKNINPAVFGASIPANFTEVGSEMFFTANDGTNGAELWKSDGTEAGTVLVKDIRTGSSSSSPSGLANVGGTLYFTANDGTSGTELWKSDGTEAGTVLVKDIRTGSSSSSPSGLANVGGTLYFTANDGTNGAEPWTSDGTSAGTLLVKDIVAGSGSSSPSAFTESGGIIFFVATGGNGPQLWRTDGTSAGTVLVKMINPLGSSDPGELTDIGGTLFFRAQDANPNSELWKSDGTSAGTVLVKEIAPGTAPSFPSYFAELSGTLFFVANDGQQTEVWSSDGTAAGTSLAVDARPGTLSSDPDSLTSFRGSLVFGASDSGFASPKVWTTDGTDPGTTVLKDIEAQEMRQAGNSLYVATSNALYSSDGTSAGTVLVRGVPFPSNLTDFDGTLMFKGGDNLYRSDGTFFGTYSLGDIAPSTSGGGVIEGGTALGDVFVFAAGDTQPLTLWASDGTTSTRTAPIASFSTPIDDLTKLDSSVFFRGGGGELWKTDGTPGGTVQVSNINPGAATADVKSIAVLDETLVFSASDSSAVDNPNELWRHDTTTAGTALLMDINPGTTGSEPQNLTGVGSTVYFTADDGSNGRELWKTDGTAGGTTLVKDINPGAGSSLPSDITNVGGAVYFVADDGNNGRELWTTDGTAAGTVLVEDLNPGIDGSTPGSLTHVGDTLFMTAASVLGEREVFKLDGVPVDFPSLVIDDVTVGEGETATFTVTASRPLDTPVTFDASTQDGTATAPGDYAALVDEQFSMPAGTTQIQVSVQTAEDATDEDTEDLTVELANAVGATIADGTGRATVTDDDTIPMLSIHNTSIGEGDPAILEVRASHPSGDAITVEATTADNTATAGSDYTAENATVVTIPAGETSAEVDVTTLQDGIDEPSELFFVNLSSPQNATLSGGDAQARGTIIDDDPDDRFLSINDVTLKEGRKGRTTAFVFTVSRRGSTTQSASMNFATQNGSAIQPGDYTATSGTLTFAAGETTKQITVTVIGDRKREKSETFTVQLSGASGAQIADGAGLGTIKNDDR